MDDEERDAEAIHMAVDELAHAWLTGWADHNIWSSTPRGLLEVWLPRRAYVAPTQFERMIAYLQQLVAADSLYRHEARFATADWTMGESTPPAS